MLQLDESRQLKSRNPRISDWTVVRLGLPVQSEISDFGSDMRIRPFRQFPLPALVIETSYGMRIEGVLVRQVPSSQNLSGGQHTDPQHTELIGQQKFWLLPGPRKQHF